MINQARVGPPPAEVRTFGLMFAAIGAIISAYLFYKDSGVWVVFVGICCFFLVTGLFAHQVLRPLYVGWMKFAFMLAWVNTRILLGVFFYLIITPMGLLMRLVGKDPLERTIDRGATSYWIKRERVPFNPKRLEQQF